MDKNSFHIVYTPPKTSFYRHAVRNTNILDSLEEATTAFEKNFSPPQSGHTRVEIFYKDEFKKESQFAQNTIKIVSEFLGAPLREWKNVTPEFTKFFAVWETEIKTIFDVLNFLELNKNENILPFSNFSVFQFYYYGLSSTENAQITYTIEEGRFFIQLELIFPHSTTEERVYILIGNLYRELPFKLNIKNFKLFGLYKNRTGHWTLDEKTEQSIKSYWI